MRHFVFPASLHHAILCLLMFLMIAPSMAATRKSKTAQTMARQGLVDIRDIDPTIKVDLMYAKASNFTGRVLYADLREAYLLPPAAHALKRAQQLLKKRHPSYSLFVYDAARPMYIQQKMWNVVAHTSKQIYVSNPAHGGGLHNYGMAVDISIIDGHGRPLDMGTPVDYMGKKAHVNNEAYMVKRGLISKAAYYNRKLLRSVMTEAGYHVLPTEWWHFNYKTRRQLRAGRYKVIR